MKHVVLDDGSNQTKNAWLSEGKINKAVIPSRVVQKCKFNSEGYHSGAYKLDGFLEYTVDGELDGAMTTDIQDFQTSDLDLVLVHEALRQSGFGGEDVTIYVTLPVEDYYKTDDDGIKNKALIDRKKENLMRTDIKNMAGHQLANIVNVKVMAESIPAWFDKLLDNQGEPKLDNYSDYKIMSVDIGGTTTDIVVINGKGVIQDFTSVRCGMFQVQENLSEILKKKFDRQVIEKKDLDTAIRNKSFNGEDISEEIIKAKKPVENQIFPAMLRMVSDSGSLNATLYAGGGSEIMAESLGKQYGGKTLKGNEFSVCFGILKFLIGKGVIE